MGRRDPGGGGLAPPNAAAPWPTAVVGLGLIGGSILRGLGAAAVPATGWDADPGVRSAGADAGLSVTDSLGQALAGARLVVVAVPPVAVATVAADVLDRAPEASVCDVCSVKGPVVVGVAAAAGAAAERFVGGHPLAGSEQGGFAASREGLFVGASWALCPDGAGLAAMLAAAGLVETLGAELVILSAHRHDEAVARSSHLAHVLGGLAARSAAAEPAATLSGGALRDASRVAGSDPALWTEILLANAAALLPVLSTAGEALVGVQAALAARDGAALRQALESGAASRAAILRARRAPGAWTGRDIELDGWRETLMGLGEHGRRVRGLRVEGDRLRFETTACSIDRVGSG